MFFSSGTNDNKPNQVVQMVKSPVKIESLNDALDTEKAEIKREPDPKTDDKNEDIKTVQVNLISSSGQENSPPDLNQDSSESSDVVTSQQPLQQPEPDFNFEIKPKTTTSYLTNETSACRGILNKGDLKVLGH